MRLSTPVIATLFATLPSTRSTLGSHGTAAKTGTPIESTYCGLTTFTVENTHAQSFAPQPSVANGFWFSSSLNLAAFAEDGSTVLITMSPGGLSTNVPHQIPGGASVNISWPHGVASAAAAAISGSVTLTRCRVTARSLGDNHPSAVQVIAEAKGQAFVALPGKPATERGFTAKVNSVIDLTFTSELLRISIDDVCR